MRSLRPAVGALVILGALILPAPAPAAIAWQPCATPTGYECGTLDVPLDRTGSAPGTVTIAAVRVRAAANPRGSALVALAGGPGQAAVPIAPDFASALSAGIADRDFLVFDQRGTGQSNPLRCAALSSGEPSVTKVVEKCANQIGPARAFFKTTDSVEDLEALRVENGYSKLALYGVSYGTKVALAYAAKYPQNVEALVLDSVVTPEGPDGLRRTTLQAAPRVVTELCGDNRCRGISGDVAGDLAKEAARLRRQRLRGPVYDADGRRRTVTLTENGLVDILVAGDLNPALRSELPGDLRAALAGDIKPLLRLKLRSAGLTTAAQGIGDSSDSTADFFVTTCEENTTFPWTRGAPIEQRRAEAEAAVKAAPPGTAGPFANETMLGGIAPICLGYPVASPPPEPSPPLPQVPTLIVNGRGDLRTPLEDAAGIAARVPGTQLVDIPNTGHSVLGQDKSGCSEAAVKAFFSGGQAAPCGPVTPRFGVAPRPPVSFKKVKPYPRTHGKVGRTLEALRLTVNDGQRQVLGEALALGTLPSGVGGLRGGHVEVFRDALRFRGVQYITGVSVTGEVPDRRTAVLRVRGPMAAHGTVRVTKSGRVSGTLDGRRVSAKFGSAARARDQGWRAALTLRQAVARGRLSRAAG